MTSENLCEPSPILAPLGEILCEPRRLWRHGSRAPEQINCEFAFPLMRIHYSVHLRFYGQLLVAVCAFINLPCWRRRKTMLSQSICCRRFSLSPFCPGTSIP